METTKSKFTLITYCNNAHLSNHKRRKYKSDKAELLYNKTKNKEKENHEEFTKCQYKGVSGITQQTQWLIFSWTFLHTKFNLLHIKQVLPSGRLQEPNDNKESMHEKSRVRLSWWSLHWLHHGAGVHCGTKTTDTPVPWFLCMWVFHYICPRVVNTHIYIHATPCW